MKCKGRILSELGTVSEFEQCVLEGGRGKAGKCPGGFQCALPEPLNAVDQPRIEAHSNRLKLNSHSHGNQVLC